MTSSLLVLTTTNFFISQQSNQCDREQVKNKHKQIQRTDMVILDDEAIYIDFKILDSERF